MDNSFNNNSFNNNNSAPNNVPDYLRKTKNNVFQPPVADSLLNQHSAKLVFSTRMYPEWMVAAYGVLKQRFPSLTIDSASEIFQLATQLLIKDNYGLIGGELPSTEVSLDFLVENGFVKASSRRQFSRISKVNEHASRFEEELSQSKTFKDKLAYWKTRDPKRAKAMEEEAFASITEGLENTDENGEEKKKDYGVTPSDNEQVVDTGKQMPSFTPPSPDTPDTPVPNTPKKKQVIPQSDTDLMAHFSSVQATRGEDSDE